MQKLVLVVDDSPTNLELAIYLLEEAGFSTLKAANGLEGIDLARSRRPHLVLCDIHMPVADGFEVARTFAKDPDLACIPLVALTASTDPDEVPGIMAHGFAGYLEKPISVAKFIGQIQVYL